jgi:hypothetical protein
MAIVLPNMPTLSIVIITALDFKKTVYKQKINGFRTKAHSLVQEPIIVNRALLDKTNMQTSKYNQSHIFRIFKSTHEQCVFISVATLTKIDHGFQYIHHLPSRICIITGFIALVKLSRVFDLLNGFKVNIGYEIAPYFQVHI